MHIHHEDDMTRDPDYDLGPETYATIDEAKEAIIKNLLDDLVSMWQQLSPELPISERAPFWRESCAAALDIQALALHDLPAKIGEHFFTTCDDRSHELDLSIREKAKTASLLAGILAADDADAAEEAATKAYFYTVAEELGRDDGDDS